MAMPGRWTPQPPQAHLARRHVRPGVAGGDDRVHLTVLGQLRHPGDRAVGLLANRLDGRFVHLDGLGGMLDADEALPPALPVQVPADGLLVADQDDYVALLALGHSRQGADDRLGRSQVTAHGVDGKPHGSALFLDLQAQSGADVPAVLTGRVRQLRRVAPGAVHDVARPQGVVRPPRPGAGTTQFL